MGAFKPCATTRLQRSQINTNKSIFKERKINQEWAAQCDPEQIMPGNQRRYDFQLLARALEAGRWGVCLNLGFLKSRPRDKDLGAGSEFRRCSGEAQ